MDNPRAQRLSRLFENIVRGRQSVTVQNGGLFLQAICAQPDPAASIDRVLASTNGLASIQDAMRTSADIKFFNGTATTFLAYLRTPRLRTIRNGAFLQSVIIAIVEPPIFWTAFSQAFQAGSLQEDGQLAFAWLLLQLVTLPVDQSRPYREDEQISEFVRRLIASSHREISATGQKIADVLASFNTSNGRSAEYGPGGRHDNDHVNFRDISILPTAQEIMSSKFPFLRPASFLTDPETEHTRVADHLDNQFRLMREDMLCEMREVLHIALGKKKGRRGGLVIDKLNFVGVYCGEEGRRTQWAIALQCAEDLPPLKKKSGEKRSKYLLDEGRNILRHQSICCLIIDDEIVAFPSVFRDEDALAKALPVVYLCIEHEHPLMHTLVKLKTAQKIKLISLNTAIFSFEFVLQALKEMTSLPLSSEILSWVEGQEIPSPPSIPKSLVDQIKQNTRQDMRKLLNSSGKSPIILDNSQAASLISALTQSVSLIQGPPGTGKSFIGAMLAKILHDYTRNTILVVCYTNHALDQFLEDLLNIGIPQSSIVRLGSKSTASTAALSLNKRGRAYKMTKSDWGGVDNMKADIERGVMSLENAFAGFSNTDLPHLDLLLHLEFEYATFFEAFQVPSPEDGMTLVGHDGRDIDEHYLVDRWVRGLDAGVLKSSTHVRAATQIWNVPRAERAKQYAEWKQQIFEMQVADLVNKVQRHNHNIIALDQTLNQNTAAVLRTARIIGCTTTAAAKFRKDIQAASPNVLLVEEAGEILESHIITALSAEMEQLILIGDHQQLRPKVNNYLLTVEKGTGYDLNRSLFERLVLNGFPHETLKKQHRMRPEISMFIRALTYPDLIDDENTMKRKAIRGLQDTVIFIAHDHPEDMSKESHDDFTLAASATKRNSYEAEMVLKILRYIGQQGYGTDRVVILTPYLGQLHLLRSMLSNTNDPVLNDLDSYDLVRAGLVSEASAKMSKKPIRLATIDNYQGEESDIVIACLTRSNTSHDIGFMSAPERLNVLLSRARDALILIGNPDTFKNARNGHELWCRFFSLLADNMHIYNGLPIKCERHPDRVATLSRPEDFDELVPDGGCQEPCGVMLSCNLHQCPSKCHALSDHSKMLCERVMLDMCSNGHKMNWKCHKKRPVICKKCESDSKQAEIERERAYAEQQRREAADREHARQLALLDAQIDKQSQALRDAQLTEQRANVIRQRQEDLRAIAEIAAHRRTSSPNTGPGQPPSVKEAGDASTDAIPNMGTSTPVTSRTETTVPKPAQPSRPSSTQSSPHVVKLHESEVEKEWERQKTIEGASNAAIDAIMTMTGLEEVKKTILEIKGKIEVAKRQNVSYQDERFNIVLLGNPGTGKTTVARQYAKFLTSFQVISGTKLVESTGSRLANDGVLGTKKIIEDILKAGGGALFIDEAYQLTGTHNFQGGQVLDFLLAEMENNVGSIVFILAGYTKQMEKFFEHNPGLPSRVPYKLHFADYTDDELLVMMKRSIEKKYQGRMKVEEGIYGLYSRIAIRRLGRGRGREGFGNARALENTLARVRSCQAERLVRERKDGLQPDDFWYSKEDLIGPDPSKVMLESNAWKKLQNMIGLRAVKEAVRSLFELIDVNYRRELAEKDSVQFSLNRVFIGSPGTGKTTVAKLYGQILSDLGLLSNGEVVIKNPSDFIGSVLGESEANTKAILAATAGKVLVIDEAYMLYGGATSSGGGKQSDIYKTAVIDTIVAEVQSTPGEDRCVLLLGYKDEMIEMFQNVNPGLSRRFAIENAFNFEDFSDSELMDILNFKLKQQDLAATGAAKSVAIEVLSRARNRPNFGNGGEVENILGQAKSRYQLRMNSKPMKDRPLDIEFEPQDFDPEYDRNARATANLQKLFEDVIGCEEIIRKLSAFQETARKMKARGMDMRQQIPTNFIMKGPPGTGKTTTARKIGQVFYDMGFLSSTEVIECSASDLVGQYVGQTGPKTKAQLEKALGRVLFIDEAYRLGDGPFAKEAIDELVSLLTQPRFHQKLVVILAGYDQDMNRLMAINPGLSSRFPEEIVFEHMPPSRCLQVLKAELAKKKVRFVPVDDPSSETYHEMATLFSELAALPSWGNARDVVTLAKQMINRVFISLPDDSSTELELTPQDAVGCMQNMLTERRERIVNVSDGAHAPVPSQLMQARDAPSAPPRAPPVQRTRQKQRAASPQRRKQKSPAAPATGEPRDAGVSDAIWQQLQADKLAQETAQREARKQLQEMERRLEEERAREEAARALAAELAKKRAADAAAESERKRQLEEARLKEMEARIKRAMKEEALRKAREAEERKRREEAKAQAKLRQMGICPAGYRWVRQAEGYRCEAGGHIVSHAQLGL